MKLLLTTYTFYGTYNELKLISNSATKGQNGVSHKAMRFGVSRLINGEGNASDLDVVIRREGKTVLNKPVNAYTNDVFGAGKTVMVYRLNNSN